MKTFLAFTVAILLLVACEQKDEILIITEIQDQYPATIDLGIKNHRVVNDEEADSISESISKAVNSLKVSEDFLNAEWILCINETGKIEKLLVHDSGVPELINLMLNDLKKWQFDIVTYKSQKSKYRINLRFALSKNEKGVFELTSSSIPLPIQKNGDTFFTVVDEMPMPKAGMEGIQRLVIYPESAKRDGVQGRVVIKAFIDTLGQVTHASILRGIGSGCDESAIEAVTLTKFTPGIKDGKPVNSQVIVPILFKLK